MDSNSKANIAVPIETLTKSTTVPPALLAALEETKPAATISQTLSKTSQVVIKSLSSLVGSRPSSSDWKLQSEYHGVPTGFSRLPLEIRECIYGLVLGHWCVLEIPEGYHKPRIYTEWSNRGLSAVLQTCRQIYEETITTLYTQNTFHFTNHNDFLSFAHTINPFSLTHISSLTFSLNSLLYMDSTPYDHQAARYSVSLLSFARKSWLHMWILIAALPNLVSLKVYLHDPGAQEWGDEFHCLCFCEKEIMEPLGRIGRERGLGERLGVFEMSVPWREMSGREGGG